MNEEIIDRAFGLSKGSSKKLEEEIDRLKKENEALKKQADMITFLTKENTTVKKKYIEMKEDMNRLEVERKVILTDKLRCEVNWHKEIQEKELLKKELEQVK